MEACGDYFGEGPNLSAALGTTGGLASRVREAAAGPRGRVRAGQVAGSGLESCRAPFGDPFVVGRSTWDEY
jgi:hypothetical protein